MDEESKRINTWLKNLIEDQGIKYEANELTMTILRSLLVRNEALDKSVELIVDDLNQKAMEYKAEADRLQYILNRIGVTSSHLTPAGLDYLKALVNLSVSLGIGVPSQTSLMLAFNELTERSYRVSADLNHERSSISGLKQQLEYRLEQLTMLNSSLQDANQKMVQEKPELERKSNVTIKFLQAKAEGYSRTIENLQQQLESAGVDPCIYHRTLVKKSEEYDTLKLTLDDVKTKVKSYHSLPPDPSLAKVEIERVKKELASLESEIAKRIDLLHM